MEQLGQFILNHWLLWLLFIFVLLLVVVHEYLIRKNQAPSLSPQEAIQLFNEDKAVFIDLREESKYKQGHILNSLSIPNASLPNKIDKYKSQPVVLVCERGVDSKSVATGLRTKGFNNMMYLTGGIAAWQAAELPLTQKK